MATEDGWSLANKLAAAALVVTLVAAVFTFIQVGQGADWFCGTSLGKPCEAAPTPTVPVSPATTPPTRTPTAKPTTHTPEPSRTTEPTKKPTAAVAWSGRVLIHKAAGIELDTAPPSQATGPAGTIEAADILLDNSRYGTHYRLTAMSGVSLADMTQTGTPDARSCLDSLQTVPVGDAPAEVGTTLCVGTGRGNLTMVRVTGDANDGLYLAVTQWQ